MEQNGPDASLRELFRQAKQQQTELDNLDPRSLQHKEALQSAISILQRCRQLVGQNAMFSTNEDLEDLTTPDIQYLGVEYILAELLLRSYGDDRQKSLNEASDMLERFLTRLDHYDMLSLNDRKLFERYREDKESFTLASAGNAEERRKTKIARFQEEKTLKNKLQASGSPLFRILC